MIHKTSDGYKKSRIEEYMDKIYDINNALFNKRLFSPEIDQLIDQYEYGDWGSDTETISTFTSAIKSVINDYKNKTLKTNKILSPPLQLRKQKITNSKKHKVTRKRKSCGCK